MKKTPFNLPKPKVPLGEDRTILYGRQNTGGVKGHAGGGSKPDIIVPPDGSGVPKKTQPEEGEDETPEG